MFQNPETRAVFIKPAKIVLTVFFLNSNAIPYSDTKTPSSLNIYLERN